MHPRVQGQARGPQALRLPLFVTRFVPTSPVGRCGVEPGSAPAAQRADTSTANSTTSQPRRVSALIRNSRQYILLKHYMSMCFIAILYCILI